jgi:hypothetical protein
VFAPTDAAFAALPAGTLDALLADPSGQLTDILKYHVLSGKVLSTDLSDGLMATTLLGKDLKITINADGVFINEAKVTVADVMADNGVVHVIDAVLVPKITTSSSSLNKNEKIFSMYPNPANDKLTFNLRKVIEFESSDSFRIAGMDGRIIAEIPVRSNIFSYNLKSLSPGMYFVIWKQDNSSQTEKLIVK